MPAILAALGVAALANAGTIAAVGGLAATGVGAALQYQGAKKQAGAEEQIANQQKEQMNLDASRQRRNIARQAILSRSSALSNATNQGAGFGASSGVAGGQSGITAQAGVATLGSNQNTQIGTDIFAQQQVAFRGGTEAATGGAISQFGGIVTQDSQMLQKVGSYGLSKLSEGWGGVDSSMFAT